MPLNTVIQQFAHHVKEVSRIYPWIVEALMYIPVGYLVARQGRQTEAAYPETFKLLRGYFGDAYLDLLLNHFDVGAQNRDYRLVCEEVLKNTVEEINGYAPLLAADSSEGIAYTAASLMTFKDLTGHMQPWNTSTESLVEFKRDIFQTYLTDPNWFG